MTQPPIFYGIKIMTTDKQTIGILEGQLRTERFQHRQTQRVAALYEHAVSRIAAGEPDPVGIAKRAKEDVDRTE